MIDCDSYLFQLFLTWQLSVKQKGHNTTEWMKEINTNLYLIITVIEHFSIIQFNKRILFINSTLISYLDNLTVKRRTIETVISNFKFK